MTSAVYSRKKLDRTNLRAVDSLLKDVEVIEVACVGSTRNNQSNEDSKLDEFQQYKMKLNSVITKIKSDIKIKQGIEDRVGTNLESIKLKKSISKQFELAKRIQTKMESAHNDQQREFDNYPSHTELSGEELQSRQELMVLMKQDLEYTHSQFDPSQTQTMDDHGFNLGRQAWRKRKEKRRDIDEYKGYNDYNPQPITKKQQQFIQESIERDAVFYDKLNQIEAGVKVLGVMADGIDKELDMQTLMLEEMEEKVDDITDRLEQSNNKIKEILDNNKHRWCPIMILCIILLALVGYIWNAFIA